MSTGLNEPDSDAVGEETTGCSISEGELVVGDVLGVVIIAVGGVLTLGPMFVSQATTAGFDDVATKTGVVSAKLDGGGSVWVLTSSVGVAGFV